MVTIQRIKGLLVQLEVDPTGGKGYHRDACVVLDATNICLKNVSRHPFLPGSLELESDSIVVQEIVEELFRKFAGNTCLLFGCCPNFYPKATEHIPLSK